jgi:hypothetical protein
MNDQHFRQHHGTAESCYCRCTVACRPVARQRLWNKQDNSAARQQPAHNNGSTIGSSFFYVVCSESVSCDRPGSVQFSWCSAWSGVEWVCEWLSELEDCCIQYVWVIAVRSWQLWHRDSSGAQSKWNGHYCKLLPGNDWWSHTRLRKLSTCCSELQSMWISSSVTVTCNYESCV